MIKRLKIIFKSNPVSCIAFLLALVTSFIVPPDKEYIGYFDFKTLSCLFTVLAVVCALKNIRFFYTLAEKIVKNFRNARRAVMALVYITFIGSMLLANDMALLTFLPLGYYVLISSRMEKYMCVTFILQNIAANLGGMLTPFGNPQNLYLYSRFNIQDGEFMLIMLPPFLLAILMITLSVIIFVKPEPLTFSGTERRMPRWRIIVYLLLFVFCILSVFRIFPYQLALLIVIPSLFILDKNALAKVDYGLLLTFAFFFVFAGNMSRIDVIRELIGGLLEKGTLIVCSYSSTDSKPTERRTLIQPYAKL